MDAQGTHTETESGLAHVSDFVGDSSVTEYPSETRIPFSGYVRHYEIIRALGAGGMASVVLARDTKIGRLVAIKFLRDSSGSRQDLLTEAQATARARHENIVVVYEVGTVDDCPYLVLEYLDGRTLRQVLNARGSDTGRALPRGLAIEIMASVVAALDAAHRSGIVHLDLKPENIILLDSGQVKVLDFGIASFMGQEHRIRAGTRMYMSPEQWLGDDVDGRSDLWAAGIIFYELLTGQHPLAPISTETLICVRELDTPMPNLAETRPELAGLAEIIAKCLQKKRENRFASASELLSALEPWVARAKRFSLGENDCPFAGLSAFQEADADRFFGRKREVVAVLGALGRQAIVAVAGPSGAGKSSFVRAGVIPALRRSGEAWDVLVVRPGRTPLAALRETIEESSALDLLNEPARYGTSLRTRCRSRGAGQRLLLFVDQFEELYTLVPDEAERAAFVTCLLSAADDPWSPVRVIISIRADFLDRLAAEVSFWTQVSTGLFFLPPVNHEGLREALTEPVLAAGYQFESSELVEVMLDELTHTKTPLPILQFSATALWETRDSARKMLTRAAYEAIGGVGGAMAKHADAVVLALSEPEQALCRAIFLRLVTPERTRALATLHELVAFAKDSSIVESVVNRLSTARLIHVDTHAEEKSASVELVHESLIERWPTLTRWLDQSAEDAHFLARLRTAATQWQMSGEIEGLLWRDRAANEARRFFDRYRQTPEESREMRCSALEERYLEAVLALSERALRQKNRRTAAAFAVVCTMAIVVTWLAFEANKSATRADDEAKHVRAQNAELALQALRGRNATRIMTARKYQNDPTTALSILREVEGPEIPKDWPELVSAAFTRGVASDVWRSSPDRCGYFAISSPDGRRIAVAMDDYTTRILDENLNEVANLRGHSDRVWTARWSLDSKRVITASYDKTAQIWQADGSGEPLVLRGHSDMVNSAALSPDGRRALTAADDKTVRIWSAEDGHELFTIKHDELVQDAQWSPDGSRIVTTALDGIARVWNADGKGAPLLLRGHEGVVVAAAFDPTGTRIATAGRDRTVRIWDAVKGNELVVLRGHEEKVMSVAWSPDGTRITSASKDKTARIWQTDGSGTPLVLNGHTHWVYSATWTPDGERVLTTSLDGTQRRWDLRNIIAPTILHAHEDTVRGLAVSPDGKRFATASYDMTVRIWNANGSGSPVVLRGHTNFVTFVRWNPDGKHLVTLSNDLTARIWSLDDIDHPIVLRQADSEFQTCEWSPDGERLVTTQVNGFIRLWTKGGTEIAAVKKDTTTEYKWIIATFDPSAKRILVQDTADQVVYVWNLDPRGDLVPLGEHESVVLRGAKWNHDGSQILTITKDGIGRLWDMPQKTPPIEIRADKPITNGIWTNNGQQLFFVLNDGTVRTWKNKQWGEPLIKGVNEEGAFIANWDPDGRRLLTAAPDGKVRVYHADGSGAPFVLAAEELRPRNALWSLQGGRILVHYEDKLVWNWPAVQPFSGLNDMRLWTATSYCLPVAQRVEFFDVLETVAQQDDEACRQNVKKAHATRDENRDLE